MVTRIVTRRIISSEERAAAAAANDSNRDDGEDNRRKDNKQSDDDDKKHDSKEAGGGGAQKLCSCNFKSCQSKAAYRGICDVRSSYHDVFFNDDTATDDGKAVDIQRDSSTTRKRPLMTDDVDDTETKGGQRQRQKFINLTDVPPKLPILSSRKGTSKYQGASFHKASNKWRAQQVKIDGKQHCIGLYDNEKEAAVDYARAVFKYEAGKVNAPRKRGQQNTIDLTDVPPKPPIISSKKGTSSKYQGVYVLKLKARNKWRAKIRIDGKQHCIGLYDNEKEAAVDYARAVFKYNKV